jgi:uncharacterized membrane protein
MSRDALVAVTRAAALACTLALIVLGILGELVWARVGHGTLALKVLPLALALPGLSRERLVTYRWLSLLVWIYAAEGALRLRDAGAAGPIAAIELALALVLFASCAAHVRARLAPPPASSPGAIE